MICVMILWRLLGGLEAMISTEKLSEAEFMKLDLQQVIKNH